MDVSGGAYVLLLGVGPTELVLIALVFLAFFGVDRIPEIMRRLGHLRARFDGARRDVEREMRTEEQRQHEEMAAFEAARERHVRAALPEVQETERLRAAAEALGIDATGRSADELRAAIRDATMRTP